MNLHKLYLGLFTVFSIAVLITGAAWREHVRDDAQRDAILGVQKSDIAGLQQSVNAVREQAQSQIAQWEKTRRELTATPTRAPEVIRELIPLQSPLQPAPATTNQSSPDAPSVTLSKQQEVDLAQYAVSCKECSIDRDQLQQQLKDEQEIIAHQQTELAAEKKAAKGGSLWQRTVRVAKWGAIFGATGYVIGRAQR